MKIDLNFEECSNLFEVLLKMLKNEIGLFYIKLINLYYSFRYKLLDFKNMFRNR